MRKVGFNLAKEEDLLGFLECRFRGRITDFSSSKEMVSPVPSGEQLLLSVGECHAQEVFTNYNAAQASGVSSTLQLQQALPLKSFLLGQMESPRSNRSLLVWILQLRAGCQTYANAHATSTVS